MTLTTRVSIALMVVIIVCFGSAFLVSTQSTVRVLEQQLYLKNADNATALALSMSQMKKDPVALELLLAAQFDTGHYQEIRLEDPQRRVLINRSSEIKNDHVPAWFVRWVSLEVIPGVAQVSDGWRQYGTLSLSSHTRFAYQSLWNETLWLLLVCVSLALISALLAAWWVKRTLRPLRRVVAQAQAMQARRFEIVPEPRIPELRALVCAMNDLSDRVHTMLKEQETRLELLRYEAHYDAVTGVLNRAAFLHQANARLQEETGVMPGAFILVQIRHLSDINQEWGREQVDHWLNRCGIFLNDFCQQFSGALVGRLNGSDFALLLPGANCDQTLLQQTLELFLFRHEECSAQQREQLRSLLLLGATNFGSGDSMSAILSRADVALENYQRHQTAWLLTDTLQLGAESSLEQTFWRATIQDLTATGGVRCVEYPVKSFDGTLLHQELMVRLQPKPEASWLLAAQVIPWAVKIGIADLIDRTVMQHALERLLQGAPALAVNLSADALRSSEFHYWFEQSLKPYPGLGSRLWVEFTEQAVFAHPRQFREFSRRLHGLGCHIGLEHAGHQVARISELYDVGLNYFKVDAPLLQEVQNSASSQAFLRSLVLIARSMGWLILAEGVNSREHAESLASLGFGGGTGPGVA